MGYFVQAVKQLEDQKSKANDNESKQAIELKLKLKKLEERLANSKWVSQGNNYVVCYEVGLSSLLCTCVW